MLPAAVRARYDRAEGTAPHVATYRQRRPSTSAAATQTVKQPTATASELRRHDPMLGEEAPVARHLQGSSGSVSARVATPSERRLHGPMHAEEAPFTRHLQGSSGSVSFECSAHVAIASERRRHDPMHAEEAPVAHHLHGCSGGIDLEH